MTLFSNSLLSSTRRKESISKSDFEARETRTSISPMFSPRSKKARKILGVHCFKLPQRSRPVRRFMCEARAVGRAAFFRSESLGIYLSLGGMILHLSADLMGKGEKGKREKARQYS